VLKIERTPRAEVPGLGAMAAAEMEQVRAIVAAAADGRRARASSRSPPTRAASATWPPASPRPPWSPRPRPSSPARGARRRSPAPAAPWSARTEGDRLQGTGDSQREIRRSPSSRRRCRL
jgi:hypothetical protein